MLPSIFGENMFDDFFSDPFGMMVPQTRDALYGKHAKNLMKTDIRETDTSYELDIDLPGFKKDEVSIDLKDGYLTISAAKGLDKDAEDKKGKYIRQERYAGACSRSFYVGEDVEPEEVSAKFEDGILTISAVHQDSSEEKDDKGSYIRRERRYGSFQRSFDVTGIDESGITAAYHNGILELTLPKQAPVVPQARQITIG